tara:strand:- start:874 stop:1386 length:513 start_codon:yes stop_codon:yes gene_type:complete
MNIFVLDEDPVKSAQAMDCVRVPKMIVESAQMMASALRRWGATDEQMPLTQKGTPYKGGYHHHPCTIWAGDTFSNFDWLCRHAVGLLIEYQNRFGKRHACSGPIVHMISNTPNNIPDGELTVFAQAMPDEFKQENAVKAYRAYYHSKMYSAGGVHYRHTSPPDWWMGVTA